MKYWQACQLRELSILQGLQGGCRTLGLSLLATRMTLDFTTVVAVDEEHLGELQLTWPTWRKHRPEIIEHPLLIVADGVGSTSEWRKRLGFLNHPNLQIVPWNLSCPTQREKMLNGLVFATATHVMTPWYLKLDTDAVAVTPATWMEDEWFAPDARNRLPAFVASPWGYTKPADAIEQLDAWADEQVALAGHPRLNLQPLPGAAHVAHPRIISWCFFGRTDWTREVAEFCSGKLPVPSQDTYLWYVAKRRGDHYRRIPMRRYGWEHSPGHGRLKRLCAFALATSPAITSQHAVPLNRKPPSSQVAESLARILGVLIPSHGKGALIDIVGTATGDALRRQRTDWTWSTKLYGSRRSASESVPPSVAANGEYEQKYDFVVLEGQTQFAALYEQLLFWWPKLTPSGVLAGINHGHARDRRGQWGVSSAVEQFARSVGREAIYSGETVWIVPKAERRSAPQNLSGHCIESRGVERKKSLSSSRDCLAVIGCYFNPTGDARLDENYHRFATSLESQDTELWTVEVAFGSSAFRLPTNARVLQLKTSDLLWQKERALNVLIERLPANYHAVAWVDCDVVFTDSDWHHQLHDALRRFPLVQCWSHAEFLDEAGQVDDFRTSAALVVQQGHPECQSFDVGHPGLAWGARRELLNRHGLYDRHITGGGDSLMVMAANGWWNHRLLARLPVPMRSDFLTWGRAWSHDVPEVGVLPGLIRHHWHGQRENRLYRERWNWLAQFAFDPTADLRLDAAGLWAWANEKRLFQDTVASYFDWLGAHSSHSDYDRTQLAARLMLNQPVAAARLEARAVT